jgi:hypothetical protein
MEPIMTLLIAFSSLVLLQQDTRIPGYWRTLTPASKISTYWKNESVTVARDIKYLKKDTLKNRISKITRFSDTLSDLPFSEDAYRSAQYALAFRHEIKENKCYRRLLTSVSNSPVCNDPEFMRAGYSALNLAKSGGDWKDMGAKLLKIFSTDITLKQAVIYDYLYGVSSEARLLEAKAMSSEIKSSWSIEDYYSIVSSLDRALYLKFKKKSYLLNAISSYESFKKSTTHREKLAFIERQLGYLNLQLSRKDYIDG